jgi:AAA+ ATPase superfamily predicted ATPase
MNFILINGQRHSGKDTLATQIFRSATQINFKNFARIEVRGNADSVKTLAKSFYNWRGTKNEDGRKLLIGITELGYAQDPFFWEKKLMEYLQGRSRIGTVIVPDFRYACTHKYFSQIGNKVFTIHLDNPNLKVELDTETLADRSEHEITKDTFNFNSIISNNGTEDDLFKKADLLVKEVFVPQGIILS